jgi:hypothetical protein
MKELYLKQNGQNEPLRYIRRDDGKDPDNSRFEYSDEKGTWATHYPSHELLVENGWKLYENPTMTRFQDYSGDYDHTGVNATKTVIDKPESEINEIIEAEVYAVSNAKVAGIAFPPEKVARAIARGTALAFKAATSSLTAEESLEANYLNELGARTEAIRTAGDQIIATRQAETVEKKTALPVGWAANETEWPE